MPTETLGDMLAQPVHLAEGALGSPPIPASGIELR